MQANTVSNTFAAFENFPQPFDSATCPITYFSRLITDLLFLQLSDQHRSNHNDNLVSTRQLPPIYLTQPLVMEGNVGVDEDVHGAISAGHTAYHCFSSPHGLAFIRLIGKRYRRKRAIASLEM